MKKKILPGIWSFLALHSGFAGFQKPKSVPALHVFLHLQPKISTNTPTIHGTHHFPGDRPKRSQSAGLKSFLHKPEIIAEEICKHESRRLKKKKIFKCFLLKSEV